MYFATWADGVNLYNAELSCHELLPASVGKNTPLEKRTPGKIGFQRTKSGGGDQSLLLDCMATAREGAFTLAFADAYS